MRRLQCNKLFYTDLSSCVFTITVSVSDREITEEYTLSWRCWKYSWTRFTPDMVSSLPDVVPALFGYCGGNPVTRVVTRRFKSCDSELQYAYYPYLKFDFFGAPNSEGCPPWKDQHARMSVTANWESDACQTHIKSAQREEERTLYGWLQNTILLVAGQGTWASSHLHVPWSWMSYEFMDLKFGRMHEIAHLMSSWP